MYLTLETNALNILLSEMNSKTISVFAFLVNSAKLNKGQIPITYREIADEMNLGTTSVGESMRLLIKSGFISKLKSGLYEINSEKVNIVEYNSIFDKSL